MSFANHHTNYGLAPFNPSLTYCLYVAGMCGCAVVGDPVVTFYDKPGTALVSGTNSYILSLALPNGNGYHCGFVYVLTNYKPHADSQLIVPKGVQIILTGNGTTSCFVSKYGVWVGVR